MKTGKGEHGEIYPQYPNRTYKNIPITSLTYEKDLNDYISIAQLSSFRITASIMTLFSNFLSKCGSERVSEGIRVGLRYPTSIAPLLAQPETEIISHKG